MSVWIMIQLFRTVLYTQFHKCISSIWWTMGRSQFELNLGRLETFPVHVHSSLRISQLKKLPMKPAAIAPIIKPAAVKGSNGNEYTSRSNSPGGRSRGMNGRFANIDTLLRPQLRTRLFTTFDCACGFPLFKYRGQFGHNRILLFMESWRQFSHFLQCLVFHFGIFFLRMAL